MTKSSRGFTLVELLAVITIIGILVALLLPAVNVVRESAHNTQCKNNLRQIGLAFASHESSRRSFPSGGWTWNSPPTYRGSTPAVGADQQAGWAFQILPFIEAESAWTSGAEEAIGTIQPTYFCPSRRAPQTVTLADTYLPPVNGGMVTRALCDYAASNRDGTGIVRRYEPFVEKKVTDGVSKTLVVGEKRMNVAMLGQPQDDDNEGYAVGWNSDTIRRTDKSPQPDHRGPGDGDGLFGGPHAGSWNAVFGDAAVHAISFDISSDVLRQLGDVDDGDTIDFDALY